MSWLSFIILRSSALRKAYTAGAIIIDVRSGVEYDQGHIGDSINIPVDRLAISLPRLKSITTGIICCCNSGARSAQAVKYLKQQGIGHVLNGGNWEKLQRAIRS